MLLRTGICLIFKSLPYHGKQANKDAIYSESNDEDRSFLANMPIYIFLFLSSFKLV